MKILLRWLISAGTLLVCTQIIPGFAVSNFYAALVAALVLGLLNAVVRPVLIVTLGLFTFVINALLIWFMSTFVKGIEISGFVPALAVAIILWAVGTLTHWMLKEAKEEESV